MKDAWDGHNPPRPPRVGTTIFDHKLDNAERRAGEYHNRALAEGYESQLLRFKRPFCLEVTVREAGTHSPSFITDPGVLGQLPPTGRAD